MTNTYKHAKMELDILFKTTNDSILKEFENEILMICEKFGQSGQSGGSAPSTVTILSNAIKTLCLFETIAPLTGEEDEWVGVSAFSDVVLYQNKRNSAVFKCGDGKAYYLDAIVKLDRGGNFWSGSVWINESDYKSGSLDLKISGRGYIKSFPFTPKKFYIDVNDVEVSDGTWESIMIDSGQLDEIRKYYYLDLSDFRDYKIDEILS